MSTDSFLLENIRFKSIKRLLCMYAYLVYIASAPLLPCSKINKIVTVALVSVTLAGTKTLLRFLERKYIIGDRLLV